MIEDKFTTNSVIHQLPAGLLQNDNGTEIFSCRKTKRVFFLKAGKSLPFSEMNPEKKVLIFEQLLNDDVAMQDLKHLDLSEALERYAFCVYGSLDSEPDFISPDKLDKSDNFLCGTNCKCLKWKTKQLVVNGTVLSIRQIEILQYLASDFPDKQIADNLNITESTLNTHKSNLFRIFGVYSKSGLIVEAIKQKIIQ